mgnify:CR=1 FL=1
MDFICSYPITPVPYDQVQIALTWLPDVLCGKLSLGLIESKVIELIAGHCICRLVFVLVVL